jgi:hypothetical protein
MWVDPPQILTLKVKVKGVALLVAVDFFCGRDYTSSAGKIRYKTSIISEALNAANAIIVWFFYSGDRWQQLETVDRLFVHNEQAARIGGHFPRKLQVGRCAARCRATKSIQEEGFHAR